jgi:putative membrane protein
MLALVLGILSLCAVWLGPLPRLAHHSFAAHMTMHMGVVAVAAPLLSLGLRGKLDPVRRAPTLFAPIPLSVLELIVVWAFHTPALHHAARHEPWMRVLEQGSFLVCGLLLWLSVLGGSPEERDARRGSGVLALLLTSMHMTLLGALLALPPRVLYAHDSVPGQLSALDDQHLGGAIMLLVGGVVYLFGGVWLAAGLLRTRAVPGSARR